MIGMEPSGGIDWNVIAGAVMVVGAVVAQSVGALRWLNGQFAKRDEALEEIREEAAAARQSHAEQLVRVEKDMLSLRSEFAVRLASIPSREAMEMMFRDKVGPLEQDLRALVIELARHGYTDTRRRDHDTRG